MQVSKDLDHPAVIEQLALEYLDEIKNQYVFMLGLGDRRSHPYDPIVTTRTTEQKAIERKKNPREARLDSMELRRRDGRKRSLLEEIDSFGLHGIDVINPPLSTYLK